MERSGTNRQIQDIIVQEKDDTLSPTSRTVYSTVEIESGNRIIGSQKRKSLNIVKNIFDFKPLPIILIVNLEYCFHNN